MIRILLLAILLIGCAPAPTGQSNEGKKDIKIIDILSRKDKMIHYPNTLNYMGQARGYDLYIMSMGPTTVSYQFPTAGLPPTDVRPVSRDDIGGYIFSKVDEKNIDAVRAKLKILDDLSSQVYDERERLERLLKGE